MNEISLVIKTIDSREVAKMMSMEHAKVMRNIRNHIVYFTKAETKVGLGEYFQDSSYLDLNNQERPCYLVTRKGCELLAHKLTGEKGHNFTVAYIEKFHEMEKTIRLPVHSYMIEEPIKRAEAWIQEQKERLALTEEVEKAELQIQKQAQMIGELKPRADYTDKILRNPGLVTITQIAKDYGKSGMTMNELLKDLGIQYKQSGQWLLYSEYHDKGYTQSETINITRSDGRQDITMNTKWTQKGRLFLYRILKEKGYLPMIEMYPGLAQ